MIDQTFNSCQLVGDFPITTLFVGRGIKNFYDAIQYVHQLPYGRNSQRHDFILVLKENRGTCSTKHALIKQLADEQRIDVKLKLGLFLMTANNMPLIEPVLKQFSLPGFPEAHCFLRLNNKNIDITFPDNITYPDPNIFLHEEFILPGQIGHYKVNLHQAFMRQWLKGQGLPVDFRTLWRCREECIALL